MNEPGNKIAKKRKDLGMTQTDFADRLGVTRQAVGRKVELSFFEGEADVDLFGTVCTVTEFQGNWMKVTAETRKDLARAAKAYIGQDADDEWMLIRISSSSCNKDKLIRTVSIQTISPKKVG